MKRGHVKSRSKSIAALIRKLISQRAPDPAYLAGYFPSYRQRLHHYELGESSIKLDSFIDLMTALRCEVVVVPLGREMDGGWYVLNDFPDNDGLVLRMPDKVKKEQ